MSRFEIVHESTDAQEADLLAEILREHAIETNVRGVRSGATIGMGNAVVDLRIEVRTPDVERARDLIESFLTASDTDLDALALAGVSEASAAPDEDDEPLSDPRAATGNPYAPPGRTHAAPATSAERPRSRLVAFCVAILVPGGGLLYARHFVVGALVGAATLVSMVTLGGPALGFLKLVDLVGSQWAVGAVNRDAVASRAAQAAWGLAACAGAIALVWLNGRPIR